MITIDRLTLRLPAGYENRARRIAPLIAHELAAVDVDTNRAIDRIRVSGLEIPPAATDRQAAAAIAGAILGQIKASDPTRPQARQEGPNKS